ncbi:hypothetical protein PAXRUDRAFT_10088 [Paxillus rubicundulus Ve08.2h10]|uniref:Uncharacterized protein n=1 Tax=Paxillus rubicundulus Ve08.2h10 TaxID=930991 RepID=A0A0D0DHE2_9AGAM|nr:hypothetical protein PAXRUDRAFT_10088 [Paxillus rubicundulus Ve08.2h10]
MATFSVVSLYQWPRHCTPKAREIVLGIIKSAKEPLSTKDIYNLAVERTGIEQATESPRSILKRLEKVRDADGTPPPHPGEEIRSLRYLKTVVLRDLAAKHHVEKVMMQKTLDAKEVERRLENVPRQDQKTAYKKLSRPFNTWLWQPKLAVPAPPTKCTKAAGDALPGVRELSPAAVGVGEDWSHLNKRRQRARKMKVERDLQRMLDLQKVQRKAASRAQDARKLQSEVDRVADPSPGPESHLLPTSPSA